MRLQQPECFTGLVTLQELFRRGQRGLQLFLVVEGSPSDLYQDETQFFIRSLLQSRIQ